MSRLPTPGGDAGDWGSILNDYLGVSHASNGTLNAGVVSDANIAANAAISKTKLASSVQASLTSADSALQPSNNLSDLGSAATARTNLGLGTAATQDSSAFLTAPAGPADGQALVWSSAQQGWVAATLQQEIAYAQITSNVTLTTTAGTAIPGLSITVPPQTGAFTLEVHLPIFNMQGPAGTAGQIYTKLTDGTNQTLYGVQFLSFSGGSNQTLVGSVTLRRRLASLATQTTYSLQCWLAVVNGGTLYAGTGASSSAYPPAYVRAFTP